MPSSTVEDYLKSILRLDEDADREITVGGIAEDLGVTPGTVSSMMRHLSEVGLVEYVPRRSVTLLDKGRAEALRVVRRHRLVETFLVTVMKLDWSEVHAEAEVLEHVISDRLLERMDEMLGHPSHDPHGDPIPDPQGNLASHESHHPLSEAAPGPLRIVRVGDSDSDFLDWLSENGLLPGREFELVGHNRIAGIVEIKLDPAGLVKSLGEKVAAHIHVEVVS